MEKFGLSADEMFARYSMDDIKEMMAGSKLYAEILKEATKSTNP